MYKSQGFTLYELIIVIALMGIVISLAVPSIQYSSQKIAIGNLSNTVTSLLTATRLYALSTSTNVTICVVSDVSDSQPKCLGRWSESIQPGQSDGKKGWIIFKDQNANGQFDTSYGNVDMVLHREIFFDENGKTGIINDNRKISITYSRKGSVRRGSRTVEVGSSAGKYNIPGVVQRISIATITGRIRKRVKK